MPSPSVAELKTVAEAYVDAGTIIATASAIIWANELLSDLGVDCGLLATAALNVATASTYVALPSDYLDMGFIVDDDDNDYGGGMVIRNGQIKLDYAGTYTLSYYPQLASVSTASGEGGTVSIHSLLKPAGGLFLASRYKSQDDDENPDAKRLFQEYLRAKNSAIAKINQSLGAYPDYIIDCYGGL